MTGLVLFQGPEVSTELLREIMRSPLLSLNSWSMNSAGHVQMNLQELLLAFRREEEEVLMLTVLLDLSLSNGVITFISSISAICFGVTSIKYELLMG